MAERELPQLSLYPEDRGCTAPTTARVLEIFTGLERHHLRHGQQHIKTFHPELTELQTLVLDLLDIPHSAYTPPDPNPTGSQNQSQKCGKPGATPTTGSFSAAHPASRSPATATAEPGYPPPGPTPSPAQGKQRARHVESPMPGDRRCAS